MNWIINFSKDSVKFLDRNKLPEEGLDSDFMKVIRKLSGENINVDIKKMRGNWKGFYRLRLGKKRIIFSINFDKHSIYVDKIDFRGDIY